MDAYPARERDAFGEWARCHSLLRTKNDFLFVLLPLSMEGLLHTGPVEKDWWGLYAFMMVLACGLFADARQRFSIDRISYLQALPVQSSIRTLFVLPAFAILGLIVTEAALRHHFSAGRALTLWSCTAWAIATSHFFPIRRWLRVPGWLLIVSAAPIVSAFAYGPDSGHPSWKRAAIASVVMATLGLALSPRSIRRPLVRPTTQTSTPQAGHPFRPSNTGVGFRQLFRFAVPQQHLGVLSLMGISATALALVILGTRAGTTPLVSWMMMPIAMASALASATSRRTFEFLGARPLRLRRILASTVLPWFLFALFLPLVNFLREIAASSTSHEQSARMTLMTFSVLFLGGVEPARIGNLARRVMAYVAALSPLALMFVVILTTPPFRIFPTPPFWSIAALAVVSAGTWYARAPWRQLSSAS